MPYLTYLAQDTQIIKNATITRPIFAFHQPMVNPVYCSNYAVTTGHAHVAEKCGQTMSTDVLLRVRVSWQKTTKRILSLQRAVAMSR
jgi:hypothetical protein